MFLRVQFTELIKNNMFFFDSGFKFQVDFLNTDFENWKNFKNLLCKRMTSSLNPETFNLELLTNTKKGMLFVYF